jgi:two-component system, NtrC family, sensor kinase
MRTEIEKEYLIKAVDSLKRELIVISQEFRILTSNKYTTEKRKTNIVGMLCHKALYSRDTPCKDCPISKVMETGEPSARKKEMQLLNPEKQISCLPIFSDGKIEALVMVDYDLSQLSKLEDQLKRSNAFLINMLQSAVDGVIAADMTGKIFIFNDAAVEITGHSEKKALSDLNIRDIYPEDGAHEVMKELRSESNGDRGKLVEHLVDIKGKNGDTIPISLGATIVYEDKKEVATIGFFHDMRKRLELQDELSKTQTQLLQAEKMSSLGKLAAGVAHQLNNPLGGITLFTQLVLEEYDLEQGAIDDLKRILKDTQRCRDTVKELLEFARQTRQEMRPHDINKAISRTMFLLENQTLFQNISIEKELSSSLPQVQVDIQQMNHMFMNIILNAAQAMDGSGEMILRTYLWGNNDRVCIEISDTGPGIDKETLKHIFEPFFTTKAEGKGTGLGLSMVYGIVENHGGTITALSDPGKGTTFIINLPLDGENTKGDKCEL